MSWPDSGFDIVPRVFGEVELDSLETALSACERTRAGARHLMSVRAVADLAYDSRLMELARSALGPGARPFRATLFDKSPDSNWLVVWHQDTALPLRERLHGVGWGPWSTKAGILYAHAPAAALEGVAALRVHLDDSLVDNGPLRVIAGSHELGVLSDAEILALVGRERPRECTVPRGGVLAMRPLLVHASSKSRTARRRRVLHLEYAAATTFDPGLRLQTA